MPYGLRDQLLSISLALPNGAATTTSKAFDLKTDATADFVAPCELLLEAPALVVGDLANASTMTYDILHADAIDAAGDLVSPAVLANDILVQTGAGGVGAAAAKYRMKPPTGVKRYVGFRATNSASGDASDKSAALWLVF